MLRRFFGQSVVLGESKVPYETVSIPGTRPDYTMDHVRHMVMEQLVDLEPPVNEDEVKAIHGLVNGVPTDCPHERTLRFSIIAATRDTGSSISTDPRGMRLNEALTSFRLG